MEKKTTKKNQLSPEDKLMTAIFGHPLSKLTKQDVLFNNALDLIMDLVEGDPSMLCELIGKNELGWCEKNCTDFTKTCLVKALKYYKHND